VEPDTEHAPAARASSILLSWMSPGRARAATAQTSAVEVHPQPHPVGHHCATAVTTAPGSALSLTDGGSHRPGKSCSSGRTTSCVTCASTWRAPILGDRDDEPEDTAPG
jgi:hypothetical protein